uniref:Uncharacterized protein n=1 Tax=Chromera velia CCMP2878 TaxID=1169474 RepID=A0A0G4I3S0_9ALVE|eukprot:Cvel_1768.t1-p1 / transcript=Cvel_1768.t1 / gene=Cvel_1768 / organism=Chromera_velia_CCMP2878 / gene_product=hypothetical protein / transcript_product=hypothetical protein / location=Cvel_scaffold64:150412-150816(+) / protein_length=135 / sequence_SO=supercontig / SO=protein_coding / is_pseudo=false
MAESDVTPPLLEGAQAFREAINGRVDVEAKDERLCLILREWQWKDGNLLTGPREPPPLESSRELFLPAILSGLYSYSRWSLLPEILNLLDFLVPHHVEGLSDGLPSLLFVEGGCWDSLLGLVSNKQVVKTVPLLS